MKHATKSTQRELFGTWLAHLTRAWRERVDARLAPFGLSQARWLILLHLSRGANGSSQKALAARVGVQGPTLVRTLDRLEAEGMIERREASQDRRAKTIHLTTVAEPVVQRIQLVADKVRGEILAGISDAALADCVRVFERIAANLGTDRTGPMYAATHIAQGIVSMEFKPIDSPAAAGGDGAAAGHPRGNQRSPHRAMHGDAAEIGQRIETMHD